MKVIILTSSLLGPAAHHLPFLLDHGKVKPALVIVAGSLVGNRRRHYVRKFHKTRKIGLLGALNGIRMRKWYGAEVVRQARIRPLDQICMERGIPLHRTPHVNDEQTRALFASSGADLAISLDNGYIAERVFSVPRYGMINIHHEILPEYQNAQSVIWQIYNGSCETGYTIHRIDAGIDTGAILYQERVPIEFKSTLGETVTVTNARLLQRSAQGLAQVLDSFEHYYSHARVQTGGRSYTTPSIWQYLVIRRQHALLRDQCLQRTPGGATTDLK
jgi:methionyl-tRNA formyltransferase